MALNTTVNGVPGSSPDLGQQWDMAACVKNTQYEFRCIMSLLLSHVKCKDEMKNTYHYNCQDLYTYGVVFNIIFKLFSHLYLRELQMNSQNHLGPFRFKVNKLPFCIQTATLSVFHRKFPIILKAKRRNWICISFVLFNLFFRSQPNLKFMAVKSSLSHIYP